MSLHDALASLASTPPRQYLQRTDAGTSILQELHQQCIEAGLVPATAAATDDISRLHALFDVCLDHGLGSLVLDYVSDVCADRLLTSSDPVAAFLLDGECVRRWCQKTLAISKGRITSWLGRGLGFIASSGAAALHWDRDRRCGASANLPVQEAALPLFLPFPTVHHPPAAHTPYFSVSIFTLLSYVCCCFLTSPLQACSQKS